MDVRIFNRMIPRWLIEKNDFRDVIRKNLIYHSFNLLFLIVINIQFKTILELGLIKISHGFRRTKQTIKSRS